MLVQGLTEKSQPVTTMVISCTSEAKEPVTYLLTYYIPIETGQLTIASFRIFGHLPYQNGS